MRSNFRRWSRRLTPKRPDVVLAARIEYAQTSDQQGMSIRGYRQSPPN